MKRTATAVGLGALFLSGAIFAYANLAASPTAQRMQISAPVSGHLWAYELALLPSEAESSSASLEIRRISHSRDPGVGVSSPSMDLRISSDDAEMVVSTPRMTFSEPMEAMQVSVWLVNLKELLAEPPADVPLRVAGRIFIGGGRSRLMPKEDFLLGDSLSYSLEETPERIGDEVCVGRFRTHDESRTYDYYCVVVFTQDGDTIAKH